MHDLEYDAMQKKRIAASARRRVCGSKSRYCGLPSDHLTPAQIKARSGPVMTYSLNMPMSYETFKAMPKDLQQRYLDGLSSRFNVTARSIGMDLFLLSQSGLASYIRNSGLKMPSGGRLNKKERAVWEKWLRQEAPAEPTLEELEEASQEHMEQRKAEREELCSLGLIAPIEPVEPTETTEPVEHAAPGSLRINMLPKSSELNLTNLSAAFTGDFDPQRFLNWISKLPMPDGKVQIRVEVTAV